MLLDVICRLDFKTENSGASAFYSSRNQLQSGWTRESLEQRYPKTETGGMKRLDINT